MMYERSCYNARGIWVGCYDDDDVQYGTETAKNFALGEIAKKMGSVFPTREIEVFGSWRVLQGMLSERSEQGNGRCVYQMETSSEGYPLYDMTSCFDGMPSYAWVVNGRIFAITSA